MKKLQFIKRSNGQHWVGDGFPVRNIFGYNDIAREISPFLMMDYAGPVEFEPTSRRRGVGEHPHRGFETVTIVYSGEVEHRDSSGGGGKIGPGDVQWMTAASGLVHEEYHGTEWAQRGGRFEMIQLWVNLPARYKMSPPRYQGILSEQIPVLDLAGGTGIARIIAGSHGSVEGPAKTFTPMNVWDLNLPAEGNVEIPVQPGHTCALFLLEGGVETLDGQRVESGELAVFEREGQVLSFKSSSGTKALLLTGEPLNEPIVGYGPFVMNSREEILQAIHDFQSGRMGRL